MEPIERCARAAAQRLATEYGEQLTIDVEAALHARESTQGPDRYVDPIALGGLIVSIATLAWTGYNDLRKTTPQPSHQVVARIIRVNLDEAITPQPAERDRIIDIVVDEVLRIPSSDHGSPTTVPGSPSTS